MIDIRALHAPLRQKYASDPEKAKYTYHVRATGGDSPLGVNATSRSHPGTDWSVSVNERVGGAGEQITPGDLLLGALCSCQALSIQMVAANLGIKIEHLVVDATGEVDHRGVLMMPGGARVGLPEARLEARLRVAAGTNPKLVQKLMHVARKTCAVTDTLENLTSVQISMELLDT